MKTVGNTAYYVRSKNAGPFWVTMDIFCDTKESYEAISSSQNLNTKRISDIYGVKEEQVKFFYLPDLKVIKISMPRKQVQGSKDERDMHSGQQYIPLLDIRL